MEVFVLLLLRKEGFLRVSSEKEQVFVCEGKGGKKWLSGSSRHKIMTNLLK